MASTLIKNGLVYDGLGNAPKKADIYIKDDRIERIGETICREADLVVDAAGRAVTPGFIDIHRHCDAKPFNSPDFGHYNHRGGQLRHLHDAGQRGPGARKGDV